MSKSNIRLSSPWTVYAKKLEAMFIQDSDVAFKYDETIPEINLFVNDDKKAEALSRILPTQKTFGNVTLNISVIPANRLDTPKADIFAAAFKGNPVFKFVESVEDPSLSNAIDFVVFAKEVVQIYTDNLGDVHGLCSTLYQDIANEVFVPIDGVYFCTDNE